MDSKVAQLLLAFDNLTPAQRNEFVDVANRYINGDRLTKDGIIKHSKRDLSITRVDLGPTAQVCPHCGR